MTRTVLLHGMHRSPNFGDVLLTQILIDHLRKVSPELALRLLAPTDDVSNLLGVRSAAKTEILFADVLLLGGGGFFQRMDGPSGSLKAIVKYALPLFLARLVGKRTAVIGAGVDRMPRGWMDKLVSILVNGSDTIAVRDQRGFDYMRKIVARPQRESVYRVSDMVFAVDRNWLSDDALCWADNLRSSLETERVIAVHLSEPPSRNEKYETIVKILVAELAQHPDTGVLLLQDHPSRQNEQAKAQSELLARLPSRHIRALPYESVERMAAVLATSDAVLTSKLHVALCAAAMETPPFAIAKHRKNLASFADIGRSEYCCNIFEASENEIERIVKEFVGAQGRFTVPAEVRERANFALALAANSATGHSGG